MSFADRSASSVRYWEAAINESNVTRLTAELIECFGGPSAGVDSDLDPCAAAEIPNASLAALRVRLLVQEKLGLVLPADGLEGVANLAQLAAVLDTRGRAIDTGELTTLTDPETLRELAERGVPFNTGLGITVESLYPEVRLRLPSRPSNHQHMGYLAIGGITAALEAAAGIAVSMHVDPTRYPLITPSLKLDVMAALPGDMTAVASIAPEIGSKLRARLDKMGHTAFEAQSVGYDDAGKKCAKMGCTFYLRKVTDWSKLGA